jgi:hypothetical protein
VYFLKQIQLFPEPEHVGGVSAYHSCGTAACALGHGPAAGIICQKPLTWRGYSKEYFGLDSDSADFDWDWCFSGDWYWHDDTPQGAGERIEYFLANGVPEGFIEDGFEMEDLLDYLR